MTDSPFSPTPEQLRILETYAEAVSNAPTFLGLTSARGRTEFFDRHVQDAIRIFQLLPDEWRRAPLRVIDVGTGNGVPGLVVGVLAPHWTTVLLDSDNKKCGFLDSFLTSHTIKGVSVAKGRAEDLAQAAEREAFDLAFARALGPVSTTLELTSGFVKPGGHLAVSRGTLKDSTLGASVLEQLSLSPGNVETYELLGLRLQLAFYKKVGPLAPKYPRRVGVPAKRPL
jgi:16S rRNA (guanine527-N7)-methyltransferase